LRGTFPPLTPNTDGPASTAPAHLLERLEKYISSVYEAELAFGKVNAIFNWLNDNCRNKEQVRYLWPVILTILSNTNDIALQGIADDLRAVKPSRNIPTLHPEVRKLCHETAGIVTAATLLGEVKSPQNPVDFHVKRFGLNFRAGPINFSI
jgi:hypothetical protein